jgi:hypothetical protein
MASMFDRTRRKDDLWKVSTNGARSLVFALALAALACARPAYAEPASTGFTYQGKLEKSDVPASTSCSFQFSLYDAATGGTLLAGPITQSGISVTDGLFTTQLNFGAGVFDGNKKWLQIAVLCTGDGGYTTLAPRQELTAVPYAMYSMTGAGGGSSQWSTGTEGIHYLGSVGIGTGALSRYKLWIANGSAESNGLYVSSSNPDYAAFFIRNSATNGWGLFDDTSGRHHLTGKLGLGMGPEYPLDVTNALGGGARITAFGSSLPTPGEGVRAALYVHGNTGSGVLGRTCGGIYASSTDARAVTGWSTNNWGVSGDCASAGTYGVLGTPNEGVFGFSPNVSLPAGKFMAPTGGVAVEALGMVKAKSLQILGGADLAEPFDVAKTSDTEPDPGTVVVIDESRPGDLRVSDRAYDTRVAGVISGAKGLEPGMVLRSENDEHTNGDHPVALTGRVWCKADASFGAIQPGDLLTTSTAPGHAMKATEAERRSGAVLGKAMTSLEAGRGMVLVLVSLQ